MRRQIKAAFWSLLGPLGLMLLVYVVTEPGDQPFESFATGFILSGWFYWTYLLLDKNE